MQRNNKSGGSTEYKIWSGHNYLATKRPYQCHFELSHDVIGPRGFFQERNINCTILDRLLYLLRPVLLAFLLHIEKHDYFQISINCYGMWSQAYEMQYVLHFHINDVRTMPASTSLVTMTITEEFFSQIILQKSGIVSAVGPK